MDFLSGEERGLEGNSWGEPGIQPAVRPDGRREGVAVTQGESRGPGKQQELKNPQLAKQTGSFQMSESLSRDRKALGKARSGDHGNLLVVAKLPVPPIGLVIQ